jgi:hypothetical protein
MDRVRVSSSNVAVVGYDEETSVLEIQYISGTVYAYRGVPQHHFEALISGRGSVGKYLNRYVKGVYPYRRIR